VPTKGDVVVNKESALRGSRPASTISINGRSVGPGCPTYIVAEMSANHNQDFDQAVKIVETAKDVGADAVKLQTYTPDSLTIDCDEKCFKIEGTIWDGRTLYDLYRDAYMPWEWQSRLKQVADRIRIDLFSTPFDDAAVDYMDEIGMPAYKVASFEIVDLPLLRRIASKGKPVIMSTGMATLGEIEEAVQTIQGAGGLELALLKCTSAYPAPPEEMNLRTIPHMAELFHLPVGLSDHTLGPEAAISAAALGACMVEKHFTLSRSTPGPDSRFSLEPEEFKHMVQAIRSVERALGEVSYQVSGSEIKSRMFRRSLFVVRDMKKGELFDRDNVRSIRPGHGMHPRHIPLVLGRPAAQDIKRGTPLQPELIG
jgi:pseudaminic acid synthase